MTTFHLKAALVFIGACCGAVISQDWFSPETRVFARFWELDAVFVEAMG